MLRFITLYCVNNFVPYKQTPEFLRYLAHRDGLFSPTSEAHYYIIHRQKELINKPAEIIEPGLVRHFLYLSPILFRFKELFALRTIFRHGEKFPAREHILVINNTFHQIISHLAAHIVGWRSLKIVGTFFHHTRRGWKKYAVDMMEWLHDRLATKIMIISPSGWEYVPKRFHYKTQYAIPHFLYNAPARVLKMSSAQAADSFSAICLSRLEPEKGLVDLIEAWKTVDPRWHLTIYGDGSLKSQLLQLITTSQLSGRVSIKDPVKHSEVFTTLTHYSVFVLTSPCEGLGLGYLEALYMKIPCVGLRVPGVRDTLAEGRGILLDPITGMAKLDEALRQAKALGSLPEWHAKIDDYFTTIVFPAFNSGTGVWFD